MAQKAHRSESNNGGRLPPGIRLYPRGQTFWCEYTLNSRRIRQSTRAKDRESAIDWCWQNVAPLLTVQSVQEVAGRVQLAVANAAALPLDSVWEEWSKLPAPQSMRRSQRHSYRTPWRVFRRWVGVNAPQVRALHEITPEHARLFMSSISARSGKTQQDYRRILIRLVEDMSARAGVVGNPFSQIPRPVQDRASYSAFTPKQLRQIGEHATGSIRHIFIVGMYTGLRLSDIVRLRWWPGANVDEDILVDLESGFISGRQSKTRGRSRSGGHVDLPILAPLAGYLRTLAPEPGEYLAPELRATYVRQPGDISTAVREFLEGLGMTTREVSTDRVKPIVRLGVHSLRHTFVYQAGMAGVPLAVVQAVVGHMSPEMTMLYNRHARRQEVAAHMARLPDLMGIIPAPTVKPASRLDALLDQLQGPEGVKAEIRRMLDGGG